MVKANPPLEFFVLDDFQPGQIVALPESCWNKKCYFRFVEDLGSANYSSLQQLIAFRARYKTFPLKPITYKKKEGESDIKAAFWELSWRDPIPVAGAYMVYEGYINGKLCDAGEAGRQLSEERQSAIYKK